MNDSKLIHYYGDWLYYKTDKKELIKPIDAAKCGPGKWRDQVDGRRSMRSETQQWDSQVNIFNLRVRASLKSRHQIAKLLNEVDVAMRGSD